MCTYGLCQCPTVAVGALMWSTTNWFITGERAGGKSLCQQFDTSVGFSWWCGLTRLYYVHFSLDVLFLSLVSSALSTHAFKKQRKERNYSMAHPPSSTVMYNEAEPPRSETSECVQSFLNVPAEGSKTDSKWDYTDTEEERRHFISIQATVKWPRPHIIVLAVPRSH